MSKIKVGIIGGAGYTGGELIRILLNHSHVDIVFIHSRSNSGKKISSVHTDLLGDTELIFSQEINTSIDVAFLCVGHGEAAKFLADQNFAANTHIIDLSQDYRLIGEHSKDFVYGLPELNKAAIQKAKHIANPGCFATAIQLALLPLAATQLLNNSLHINATTGSTGAGQSLADTSHFSWRQNNLSVYKAFTHQHLNEIKQSLSSLQHDLKEELIFIPQRGAFTRGILANVVMKCEESIEALIIVYKNYYKDHPFVHISDATIDLKQVVNTNKCVLYLEKQGDYICVVSIIDNLIKGASGQAVQNMNLIFGLEETAGLKLKATAF
jgi:N-acetyl-gamma-glutamyl-phosphate reductase